jgi:hypothetical protein
MVNSAKPHVVCLGYGFVATRFAQLLRGQGWSAAATARTDERQSALNAAGITPVPFQEGSTWLLLEAVLRADAILITAPPGAEGDPFLSVLPPRIEGARATWVGYLSTTGVFGDRNGGWAFDDDAPTPQSVEGQRRVDAEEGWLQTGLPVHRFRLPGIYGPGRSAFDRLREGKANRIIKAGQVFSRAHRDDIADALRASLARPNPGRCYSICDDEPAAPALVVEHAANLLGIKPPPIQRFEEAELSPMARRFYGESKRVSNARAKAELGWRPRFPTYREGLEAILAAESRSPTTSFEGGKG